MEQREDLRDNLVLTIPSSSSSEEGVSDLERPPLPATNFPNRFGQLLLSTGAYGGDSR
jgi:hypothetical protein